MRELYFISFIGYIVLVCVIGFKLSMIYPNAFHMTLGAIALMFINFIIGTNALNKLEEK